MTPDSGALGTHVCPSTPQCGDSHVHKDSKQKQNLKLSFFFFAFFLDNFGHGQNINRYINRFILTF